MQKVFDHSSAAHLLASIRASITQPYYLADEAGIIQDANEAFASAMGYPPHEVAGLNFSTFMPQNMRPYALLHHQEYFSQAYPNTTEEWDYQDKHEKVRSFQVISSLLQGEEGQSLKMNILIESPRTSPADLEKFKHQSRHMFKNTLQEVSGLLQIQAARAQGETSAALSLARQRSAVIAAAFDQLYKYEKPDQVELSIYLIEVLKIQRYPPDSLEIHTEVYLNISNCYALGLLIHEILNTYREQLEDIRIQGKLGKNRFDLKLISSGAQKIQEIYVLKEPLFKALQQQLHAQMSSHPESNVLLTLSIPL